MKPTALDKVVEYLEKDPGFFDRNPTVAAEFLNNYRPLKETGLTKHIKEKIEFVYDQGMKKITLKSKSIKNTKL